MCHGIGQIDTVLQHQFLFQCLLVFFIREPAILVHGPEDIFFSLLIILRILVGVVPCGRIGNADNTGTFGSGQTLHFFSVIGGRRTADTTAVLTQVNKVQIQLQNFILIIALFQLYRPENLQHFTLDGDIISSLILCQQHIFDELLGDAGTTGRVITKEHSGTGLNGGDPVNALMFKEAVILNGHRGIDHILRNVLKVDPGAAGFRKNFLIFLNIAVRIQTVHKGGLLQIIAININICHWENIILQIIAQNTRKNKAADHTDDQNRAHSTQCNLECTESNTPQRIHHPQESVGLPLLPLRLLPAFLFLSVEHSINTSISAAKQLLR